MLFISASFLTVSHKRSSLSESKRSITSGRISINDPPLFDLLSVYEREREACLDTQNGILEALIFSDSHGAVHHMRRVINDHPHVTHILFCGDGLRDAEALEKEFPKRVFLTVKGNCDGLLSSFDVPYERLFTLGSLRILMMHGHTHGVKGSYGVAASHAAKQGASLLLFGHTHLPYEGRLDVGENTVHLFNPGSIGASYHGASYGILTIRDNGYLLSHGTILDDR